MLDDDGWKCGHDIESVSQSFCLFSSKISYFLWVIPSFSLSIPCLAQ